MYRIALILVCLGLAAPAIADGGPRPDGPRHRGPPSAEQMVARMSEELALSDEQSAQLLEILQRAETEREALRAKVEAEMRPQACALHARVRDEVRAVLDEEQAARLDQHMERRAESGEHRRGKPPLWADCEE